MDESYPEITSGRFLYALSHVVTTEQQRAAAAAALTEVVTQAGLPYLHFADEDPRGRVGMAKILAELDITGSIVVSQTSAKSKLELCRRRLLTHAAFQLHRTEHVTRLVIESRHQADKHDRKTVNMLRTRHQIRAEGLYVDFQRKSDDPVLWIADCLASAFTRAEQGADPEPWRILDRAHLIDVQRL